VGVAWAGRVLNGGSGWRTLGAWRGYW
jgi:hypothetical protein